MAGPSHSSPSCKPAVAQGPTSRHKKKVCAYPFCVSHRSSTGEIWGGVNAKGKHEAWKRKCVSPRRSVLAAQIGQP